MEDTGVLGKRGFLVSVGAIISLALPGCTLNSQTHNEKTEAVEVDITNNENETKNISIIITHLDADETSGQDGSVILDESVAIEPNETSNLSFQNPRRPGRGFVSVEIPEIGSEEERIPLGKGSGIIHISITIDSKGEIDVSSSVR